MDGTRPPHPLSDSRLDRELESALSIEPSPDFLARVRTRIAVEPESSGWHLAHVVPGLGRNRRWAVEAVAALALIGIVLTVVVPRWMRDDEVRRPPVAVTAAVADNPGIDRQAPVVQAEEDAVEAPPRPAIRRPASVREVPLRLSKPLFSDDDRRALMQLVAAVEERRMPPVVQATPTEPNDQPSVSAQLRIEPLVIDPLPLLARVRKEGEVQW